MRELRADWQAWLAENLLAGVPDDDLVEELTKRGVRDAAATVVAMRAHPILRAAMPFAETLRRRDSLLGVQAAVFGLSLPYEIPRGRGIDAEEFVTQHYAASRPVILTKLLNEMPARRWTLPHLARVHGALEVEIQDGRDAAPRYQRDFEPRCRRLTLAELIARIDATPSSNDFYLTAKNRFFAQPGAEALLAELQPLPDFLRSPPSADDVALWIGPAGTFTPLHFDWVNSAIAQLRGKKRFLLVPPWEAPRVGNRESRFADLDAEALTDARVYEVVLEPGELLFVPVGWWHQARALEPSLTVSFTSFRFPNRYAWDADTTR